MFTATQNEVIALLAAGRTVTSAAAECDLHRTTIHAWGRTNPDFHDAVRDAQIDAAAAKRDLYIAYIQESLAMVLAVMRDPKSSPGVRLKAALHILKEAYAPAPKPQTAEERRHHRLLRLGLDSRTEPQTYPEFVAVQQAKDQAMLNYLADSQAAAREQEQKQEEQQQQPEPPQRQNSSEIITSTPAPAPTPASTHSSEFITSAENEPHPTPAEAPAPAPAASSEIITPDIPLSSNTAAIIRAYLEQMKADLDTREAHIDEVQHQQHNHQNSSPNITTFVRPGPKVGRNDQCPCGSNKKFKHCCLDKKPEPQQAA